MAKRVLLVLSAQDAGLQEELTDCLDRLPDVHVDFARNRQKAMERLKSDASYDMVVIGAALAHDSAAAVTEDGGLRCCKTVRLRTLAPILLLVPRLTNHINMECAQVPEPHPVAIEMTEAIAEVVARQVLSHVPPSLRLDVVILAESGEWRYEMRGVGFEFEREGALKVSKSTMLNWRENGENRDNWYFDFERIGTSIKTCLCEENPNFEADRREGTARAGGHANTHVSFVVERSHYELVLEAIFNPPEEVPEPWLIHAPLLRHIKGTSRKAAALFQGPPRPLRCLLICAETSGFVDRIAGPDGNTLFLRELPMIRKECEKIERFLTQESDRSERVAFEPIEFLRNTPEDGPVTKDRLLRVLREQRKPWDLVHFAGHSYFQSTPGGNGSAYLFATRLETADNPEGPEAIDFHSLVPYFRAAKFLYLSSCESSNAGFAVEATNSGIDAFVGYRHRVDDEGAYVQARMFYRELLKHLSVDTAFWRARRRFHHYFPKKDAWASAMLVTAHH